MRRALGDRAVAAESFLVSGERPAHDRWCRAEPR
ncbi:hypothetical protein J2S42_001064 [Catenuloplanes indicus]|uniref:Uncharacterized protein n=1 Tax=Catenuloplanes indicus TaxID=137267 RepID=A0AAE4AV15_9ACTN|nr:hypothetical protein [Catenuloplanes indicus]